MADYRISVEEEPSIGFKIVLYAVLFSILLPIGACMVIIWICIKLYQYWRGKRDQNNEESPYNFHYNVEKLYHLQNIKQKGLLSEKEYEKKRKKFVRGLRIYKTEISILSQQLDDLTALLADGLITDDEFEKRRKKVAKRMY